MRFQLEVRQASTVSEHDLEFDFAALNSPTSKISFALDARPLEADLAEFAPGVYSILLGSRSFLAEVGPEASGDREQFAVRVGGNHFQIRVRDPRRRRHREAERENSGPQEIAAPMPGRIVKVLVEENQEVGAGQGLLVIEAMKMQNELRAPRAGRVEKIYVRAGAGVESGAKLLRLA